MGFGKNSLVGNGLGLGEKIPEAAFGVGDLILHPVSEDLLAFVVRRRVPRVARVVLNILTCLIENNR